MDPKGSRLPQRLSWQELTCQCRRYKKRGFNPWVRKIPWSRRWQPTPVFLPGKFHGQRSLAGYNSQGHKELDTTEQLSIQRESGCPELNKKPKVQTEMRLGLLTASMHLFAHLCKKYLFCVPIISWALLQALGNSNKQENEILAFMVIDGHWNSVRKSKQH